MTKEERILRYKFPDRTEFTKEEFLEVRRLLAKDDYKDESGQRLPNKFVEVGAIVTSSERRTGAYRRRVC